MGVPKLLKLLYSLYFEYDSGLHNNKKIKEIFGDEKNKIDIYIDFNSLLYLFEPAVKEYASDIKKNLYINLFIYYFKKNKEKKSYYLNEENFKIIMKRILSKVYSLFKKNYKSYVFIDGIPSMNKILD